MLTEEQRELFQKDKYELVDIIVGLRSDLRKLGIKEMKPKTWTLPVPKPIQNSKFDPPEETIEKVLNKLKKEMDYGIKEENKSKASKEEEC
jgi:hypothetical protein